MDALEAFEKSKYQSFVAILLALNFLLLYAVAIAPFVLILGEKEPEEGEEELVTESDDCDLLGGEGQDPLCTTAEDEFI